MNRVGLLALLALSSLGGVACSGSRVPQSEGETHWLSACSDDDDCDRDHVCVCGVCTVECEGDRACRGDVPARCIETGSPGLETSCSGRNPERFDAICLPDCDEDEGCGRGQSCLQGACVAEVSDRSNETGDGHPPDAGDPDPHHDEREEVIDAYCALLDDYPCLEIIQTGVTRNVDESNCRNKLNTAAYLSVAERCWELWVATMQCLTEEVRYRCPCDAENACEISDGMNGPLRPPCDDVQQRYNECHWTSADGLNESVAHYVTGEAGTCSWWEMPPAAGCQLQCMGDEPSADGLPQDSIGARCFGPPGGPYSCNCTVNTRDLLDSALTGAEVIDGEDCTTVAQKIADGACFEILDCCIRWVGSAGFGTPAVDRCSCTADPRATGGWESCQELADALEGEVVDLCPQYQPDFGGFIR